MINHDDVSFQITSTYFVNVIIFFAYSSPIKFVVFYTIGRHFMKHYHVSIAQFVISMIDTCQTHICYFDVKSDVVSSFLPS